jgi:hypothetical protein
MAVLLLLLAIIGAVLVGDLVVENTAAGSVTVLQHLITGYSQGQLLAMAAALGFVVGLLAISSVSMRRTRRARRRQLRTVERDLTAQLAELERDNASLRNELVHLTRRCASHVRLPCQPILARPHLPQRLSGGRGSVPRGPTAIPSRSTRRPSGPPVSVATWIDDMWPAWRLEA